MMLTLLAYAYSVGECSSRGVERRCREDVAFRVITANRAADHATIARFRVRHEAALADLFGQVLGLCAQAGLVEVGVLAVDGTKLAAAASNHSNRSYEQIAEEIIQEAGRIDDAEDELYGEARGDELPERLASREGRRAWLREAKERLERERAERAEQVPRERQARLELCRRRLVADWQTERRAHRDYEAYRERGIREPRQAGDGCAAQAPATAGRARGQDQRRRPRLALPTIATVRERRASAGPTTSCEGSSPQTKGPSSTHAANGWSSRSLPRSRRTDGSGASNEEGGPPRARNGASLPPPTTS